MRHSIACPVPCGKVIQVGVRNPTIMVNHESVNSRLRHALYNHLRSQHPDLGDRERTLLADKVVASSLPDRLEVVLA